MATSDPTRIYTRLTDATEARRLADQAEADATLAETRAQAVVETENLKEMKGTVGDLEHSATPAPATLVPN